MKKLKHDFDGFDSLNQTGEKKPLVPTQEEIVEYVTQHPTEKVEVLDNITRKFRLVGGEWVQVSKTVRSK